MVTAIVSQVDSPDELAVFWRNVYLRGQMLYDPTSLVGNELYQQPYGGVPFSRGWIIGADQTVVLPLFGHDPRRVIDTINGLLDELSLPGDVDGNGLVDVEDLLGIILGWGPCPPGDALCPADVTGDGEVGVDDLLLVIINWGPP